MWKFASLSILLLPVVSCAKSPSVFFSVPWGTTFQRTVSEQGDTLSVGAIFSDSAMVCLYDIAAGRITSIDSRGRIADTVRLESTGRGYAGEDFIVRGAEAIFLNTVDRRLEFFDTGSGKHLRSVPLPSDLFPEEKSRIRRALSRIFLDGGRIYVGNPYHVVPVQEGVGKSLRTGKTVSAAKEERFVLYRSGNPIVRKGDRLVDRGGKTWKEVGTRYPVWGKQYAWIEGDLHSLRFGDAGISIVRLPPTGAR